MAEITVRAPCRVDLAGGTLDIWPLGLLHGGARTVNVAISLATQVALALREEGYRVDLGDERLDFDSPEAMCANERTALVGQIVRCFDLPPCELRPTSESPRGAGLGASSALMIAGIVAAEHQLGRESPSETRAAIARDLEARLMSLPTGNQDHFPPQLGGALEICYLPGGDEVRRLPVDLGRLGDRLIVAFTGKSHFSAGSNWRMVKRRLDGDAESARLFAAIAAVASEVARALVAEDWSSLGSLMAEEWSFRRQLAAGISTPTLERQLAAATRAGAWGGKACGAGGGGCIAILCPPERRESVAEALAAEGAEVLPVRPVDRGLTVTVDGQEPGASG